MMSDHWVGYQNLEPFVWLVLIDQVLDMCSVYWSRFPELCLIKTTETKGSGFGIPPSVIGRHDCVFVSMVVMPISSSPCHLGYTVKHLIFAGKS